MKKQGTPKKEQSRINQIEQQLKQDQQIRYQQEEDIDNSFIEEDMVQQDKQNSQKRIKPAKRISIRQKKNITQFTDKEQQIKDQQSKTLMENIMKKKLDNKTKILDAKVQQEIQRKLRNMQIKYKQDTQNDNLLIKQVQNKINHFYDEYQAKQDKLIQEIETKNKPLDFFLSEIVPDKKKLDVLYLFGKIQYNKTQLVNTCIQVQNQMREIFIMPKKNHNADEVLIEIKQKIQEHSYGKKIQIKYEIVKRKYCFEYDVDYRDQEVDVVRIQYSFADKELKWLKQVGDKYKGIFGLTYKSEELFLLQNRIRGTEWIQVNNYKIDKNKSFTQNSLNIIVDMPWNSFVNIPQNIKIPKFSIAALQVEFNTEIQKIEALCYSLYQNFDIQNSKFEVVDNFILTTKNTDLENDLQDSKNERFFIKKFDNEYQMLVDFSLLFSKSDPDLVVGHEIIASTFEVIIKRMQNQLIDKSNLGRLGNNKHSRNRGNLKYNLREIFSGRLLFDIYEQSQNMIKLDSYSLQDMIRHFFPDKESSQDSIREKLENNLYLLKIGDKLKIFYLTLQLSQVAGCLWEVSLRQARAQRNEILLLQEFYNRGYIIPDNELYKTKGASSKYSGGKVLDPKVGFYETYTILVDFNSLYPSIIRHYGICFTTVRRNLIEVGYQDVEEDDFEGVKDQSDALGCIEIRKDQKPILPGILERLIDRRKKAKNDLKVAKKFKDKELEVQLNIKQQALKLIANSIYGCLGFSFSRFYAKKLAMMITYFGRKLLESSIELVENSQYEVIYGDTDSIMIQTGMNNTREAVAEGLKIKKLINKQFHTKEKKQILEVELDGVFKKMLLIKKKKYAGLQIVNYTDVLKKSRSFKEIYKLEVKGLDMVRRDWSELTKVVSEQILNLLMYSQNPIEDVQQYIKKVNYRLDEFQAKEEKKDFKQIEFQEDNIPDIKIRHNLFLIRKQLKKKTNEYADADNIPHVKVAKDMMTLFKKTQNQLINHFIPYVITITGKNQAQKAHHFGEFMSKLKQDDRFYLDFEFYKKNQLINPLERLINPIDSGLNDRINEIFGYSKQTEDLTNEKAEIFQKSVEKAQDNLGHFFKNIPELDVDDYLFQCQKCQGFCYSFQYKCQREQDDFYKKSNAISKTQFNYPIYYENKIYITLKKIIKENYIKIYKCFNCNYKIQMPFFSKKCPACHELKVKEILNNKILLGKLLFYNSLCKEFSREYEQELTPVFFKEKRKPIQNLIMKLQYESKDLFQPFQKYIKQYGESLKDKILVL